MVVRRGGAVSYERGTPEGSSVEGLETILVWLFLPYPDGGPVPPSLPSLAGTPPLCPTRNVMCVPRNGFILYAVMLLAPLSLPYRVAPPLSLCPTLLKGIQDYLAHKKPPPPRTLP